MPKNLTQRDHTGTLIWKHAFICCYYVVLTCKSSIKRGESVAKFPQDNWEAPARASWLDSVFAVSQSGGSTFCAVKIRIFIHRSDHRSASGSSKYNVSSYYPKQEKILSWFQTKKWYPPRVFSPICWIEIFLSRKQSPLNRRDFLSKKKNSDTCGAGGIQRTTFTIHRKCRQWCRAMDARGSVRGLGSVLVEIFQGFGVNTPWWNQRSLVMSRWVVDQGGKRDKENKEMEDSDSCVFFSDALEGILLWISCGCARQV